MSTPPPHADRWRWAVPLVAAAAIWLLPHAGFPPASWGLLCLFAATVCALITRPLPAGALMIVVISLGMLCGCSQVQDALSGFSNGRSG
jgi:DASS family divalent anion:Na+ symporter